MDFVCPRGWAYITNSRFFASRSAASGTTAAATRPEVRHRHSTFDGVPEFALGRNHRDAQFYLVDAEFSAEHGGPPDLIRAPAPDPRQWGERYYYANAREAADFAWFADNLHTAEGSPREEDMTAAWTFGGRGIRATLPAVLPFAAIPRPENGWQWVDPSGVTLRWTPARNARAARISAFDGIAATCGRRKLVVLDRPAEPGGTYHWRVDDGPSGRSARIRAWTRIALVGDSTVTEKSDGAAASKRTSR